jgi:signal transduction histidine kinase
MGERIFYFGLPELILFSLALVLIAGLIGWFIGWLRYRSFLNRAAAVLGALPYGALIVKEDGRVILANSEARSLWGERGFPSKLEGSWAALAGEVRESQTSSVHMLEAPTGLKLHVRAAPLGRRGRALFVLEDAAARLRQRTFYRSFISNVSHELKTPLTVIQGHVAAMEQAPADDDRWRTSRRIVAEETARLTQLVENLLLLSRLEMPDFVLDRRQTSVEAIAEDAILELTDLAEARDVSLNLQRKGHVPRVLADRARLKQVLINLLDNGIKYNRPRGKVTVGLTAGEKDVVIQVADTGEGIPARDLPHIFDRMYRVERRQGRPVEGSGLGLSIVQRIVEQHGGNISVESAEGRGTTFTLTLPREPDGEAGVTTAQP